MENLENKPEKNPEINPDTNPLHEPFSRDEDFADAMFEYKDDNSVDPMFDQDGYPGVKDVVVLKNNNNDKVFLGQVVTTEDSQVIKSLDESFGQDITVYSTKDGLIEMNKDLLENYTVMMPEQDIVSPEHDQSDILERKVGILNSMDLEKDDVSEKIKQAKEHNDFISQFGIQDEKSVFAAKSKILTKEAQETIHDNENSIKGPEAKKEGFSAEELNKAMNSVKFDDQDVNKILYLQSLNETGKEITAEQKKIVLESDLTDEHKVVLLTFLNDPDPKKTISEDYKTKREHEDSKNIDVSKSKDKNLAQKAATGIEKISRFTVD